MLYVGIDPGSSGAIVALTDQCDKFHTDVLRIIRLDEAPSDIAAAVSDLASDAEMFGGAACVMEKVGPNRGEGGRRQGASSMFTFGLNVGRVEMAILSTLRLPLEYVQPVRWQAAFGLLRKNKEESTTEKKRRHKEAARRLFPQQKVTLQLCDALLIAEYCRRVKSGELERAMA